MSNRYDYVVVGGGPSGLSASWYLAKNNKKVLIIDKNTNLGGAHRVMRINSHNEKTNMFSEHSPRVYNYGYSAYIEMLKDMGMNFYDLYKSTPYSIVTLGLIVLSKMKIREMILMIYGYFRYISVGADFPTHNFMTYHNFSVSGYNTIDRVCRLIDGAGSDRVSLSELFASVDLSTFNGFCLPTQPSDEGVMKNIESKLRSKGVDILKNAEILSVNVHNNRAMSLKIRTEGENSKLTGFDNIVMAILPSQLEKILNNSDENFKRVFGDQKSFKEFVISNKYETYPSLVFFWKKNTPFKTSWGFPAGEWGVINIVVSDVFIDSDHRIMSITLAKPNDRNQDGLTFYEHLKIKGETETAYEILKQIRTVDANLPTFNDFYFNPNKEEDSGFVNFDNVEVKFTTNSDNIFWIGCHNDPKIKLTTLEKAVRSGIQFVNEHLKLKPKISFPEPLLLNKILYPLLYPLIIMFRIIYYFYSTIFEK